MEETDMAEKINKYEAIAPQILELVGGKDNIRSFAHCMTRLRFNVKDKGLVDADKIGKLPGCMGTQWAGDQLQVIIGQAVDKAYDAICAAGGLQKEAAVAEDLDSDKKKKFSLTTVCEAISGCIVPLIPLFMASGLIKVVLVMANLIGILPADSSTYTVLGYAADAALYFMPILIGYTAAKKFGADPSLAMGLCALLVYPNLMTALGGETPVTIFGLPVYNATYTNMMFPSIMVVFVMSYVERFFKKYVPEILRVMLVPLGTFLVMLPLSLCLVAPAGVFLGNGITWLVETIYNNIGFLGVGVLSGLYPLLILTGMHSTLAPVCISYFTKFQYDPLIIPACYIANFGQAAAAAGCCGDRTIRTGCTVGRRGRCHLLNDHLAAAAKLCPHKAARKAHGRRQHQRHGAACQFSAVELLLAAGLFRLRRGAVLRLLRRGGRHAAAICRGGIVRARRLCFRLVILVRRVHAAAAHVGVAGLVIGSGIIVFPLVLVFHVTTSFPQRPVRRDICSFELSLL